MTKSILRLTLFILLATGAVRLPAEDAASDEPKIIPRTRPEMKTALEALKLRQPRLPLLPLSPEEIAGGRFSVNNGRMRSLYLPEAWSAYRSRSSRGERPAGQRRYLDSSGAVDGVFKVWLFWVVSRANNCHYCLGHQELKLKNAGLSDEQIAALDGDWSAYSDRERTAMELTYKLTVAPHTIEDADIDALRPHWRQEQILEIVQTVAGYNSTNRWTDSLGIPQDDRFGGHEAELNTPTSPAFATLATRLAPLAVPPRPVLESRDQVEATWIKCRTRRPRLPLADDAAVATTLPEETASPIPNWVRLFAAAGGRSVATIRAVAETGRISPILKAQIAWCTARENRAWYAAHDAKMRLNQLGLDDEQVFALDGAQDSGLNPADCEALAFARKLTARPFAISDADIARLRKHYKDGEVAEIVYVVCQGNMFDRFTEAAGLPLD
ncbi:MAG: carboxymuconolactone decarboxylase family protein [Planctomycetes bacterium]|nr:carboxymuconolactone decarboxylase family protein [Planctomycetota bacterium]